MDEPSVDNVIRAALSSVERGNPYSSRDLEMLMREMFSNPSYEKDELAVFPAMLNGR